MKCPACQTTLITSERMGLEIDVCPTCRGVWLDPGELEAAAQRGECPPRLAADWDHCVPGARPGRNSGPLAAGAFGLKCPAPLPRHLACFASRR